MTSKRRFRSVATLAVRNRVSRRDASELVRELFGAALSTGSVDAIVQRAGEALEQPYAELAAQRGYLVHYGRPRLFMPRDRDTALLLGDYLYGHGLVRIASLGDTTAVHDLAELISICARLRGENEPGDGVVWAVTAHEPTTSALEETRAVFRESDDLDPARRARARGRVAATSATAATGTPARRVVHLQPCASCRAAR
jgi:hypothetical protein